MKSKAQQNIAAAQILIDKHHYTESVHCSYYAVFQYMKYMLANTSKRTLSYQDQENLCNHLDSHETIIIEIRNRIDIPQNARDFCQRIRNLKNQRVSADYKDIDFSVEEGLDCKQEADGLISKLKQYFGNI